MAEEKSTLSEFKDAYKRLRGTLDKTEQKIEQKTGAVMRFGCVQLGALAAGAAHEAAGKIDERYGMPIARVAGVNVSHGGRRRGPGARAPRGRGQEQRKSRIGALGAGIEANFSSDTGGRLMVRNIKKTRSERDAKREADAKVKAAAEAKAKAEADAKAAEPAQAKAASS